MDNTRIEEYIEQQWNTSIIPTLEQFIRIPNKSPLFDEDWVKHGYMEQAVELLTEWSQQNSVKGMTLDVIRLPERTPLIFIEIPGQCSDTVLLYGHLDKQPEMVGWRDDLGPWKPVIEGDKLYGRGGADDGYALFSSLSAIKALQQQNIPHARCIILIEACEESGSYDLPHYMKALADRIGQPQLVICLDSGCGNYQQLWNTTSLRGIVAGDLKINILSEGVHSGNASGIVPSSFRILRQLLSRIEDENSGDILLSNFHVTIPDTRILQAKKAAQVLKEEVYSSFPFVDAAQPVSAPLEQLILNRTWRPTLSVIGCDGIPRLEDAGSVLRPYTTVKLSFRIPPNCDPDEAAKQLKTALESDPPFQSQVSFKLDATASGWEAPHMHDWLINATNDASITHFGKESMYMGEGGSIPFMAMLGEQFPEAQFLITGVLGPHSNAHGPNEFLHIPAAKKLTCCIAYVISKHYEAILAGEVMK